jgi:hypothetical protein
MSEQPSKINGRESERKKRQKERNEGPEEMRRE